MSALKLERQFLDVRFIQMICLDVQSATIQMQVRTIAWFAKMGTIWTQSQQKNAKV